eukprot:UN1061
MGLLLGLWSLERTPAARVLRLFCPSKRMAQKLEDVMAGDFASVKAWERPLVDEALGLLQPWAGRVVAVFEGSASVPTRADAEIAASLGPRRYPLLARGQQLLQRVAEAKSSIALAVQGRAPSAFSSNHATQTRTGRSVQVTGARNVHLSSRLVAQVPEQHFRCSVCLLQLPAVHFSNSQRKKAASKRRCELCV